MATKTLNKTLSKVSNGKKGDESKKPAKPGAAKTEDGKKAKEKKEPKEKKPKGPTFGEECLKLLVEEKFTDEQIREKLAERFPNTNGVKSTTHIKWYRSRLNAGQFDGKGFKVTHPIKAIREKKEKPEGGKKKEKVLSRGAAKE